MPLKKWTSKRTFREDVCTEIQAGKPVKQSIAIAYSVQRKGKAARAKAARKKAK